MPAQAGIHDFLTKPQTCATTPPPSPRHGRESGHPRLLQPEALSMKLTIFLSILTLCTLPFIAPPAQAASTIPFVGCSASGSQDVPAPSGAPVQLNIPPNIAAKLALYAGAYQAILAPRGWDCSGGVGTDAISLSIAPPKGSPHAKDSSITIRTDMEGTGSDRSDINTFGRTYFPKLVSAAEYNSFVTDWDKEGGIAAPPPATRYSTDRLTYLSPSALEYETPPAKDGIAQLGIGGNSRFAQYGIISIQGKYLPDDNEDDRVISFIRVTLPPNLAYLTKFILGNLCVSF
jgi:hypothetical protein